MNGEGHAKPSGQNAAVGSVAALDVDLAESEIGEIEGTIQEPEIAGKRYDEHQMSMLDSEKE